MLSGLDLSLHSLNSPNPGGGGTTYYGYNLSSLYPLRYIHKDGRYFTTLLGCLTCQQCLCSYCLDELCLYFWLCGLHWMSQIASTQTERVKEALALTRLEKQIVVFVISCSWGQLVANHAVPKDWRHQNSVCQIIGGGIGDVAFVTILRTWVQAPMWRTWSCTIHLKSQPWGGVI